MDNFDLKRFLVENRLTRNSISEMTVSNTPQFGEPTTTFDKPKPKSNTPPEPYTYDEPSLLDFVKKHIDDIEEDITGHYHNTYPRQYSVNDVSEYEGIVFIGGNKNAPNIAILDHTPTQKDLEVTGTNMDDWRLEFSRIHIPGTSIAGKTKEGVHYIKKDYYWHARVPDKPTLKENKMNDFDLKRFLVENRMTRNSRLLKENQIPYDIEEFLNDMINSEVLEDLSDNVEEWDNVNGVWEIEEYGNEDLYGDAADDFKKAYQYIKDQGGQITIPGNPDVTYNAIYDGSIGYSLNVTLNESAKLKWTPEKLEQEAAKYDRPSEFQKANLNVYNIYRIAVRKGIIQDKFEQDRTTSDKYQSKTIWTPETLEQEAAKYNTPGEFQMGSPSAYGAYRRAVKKGLIQNKFEEQFRWTKDALEQELTKYNTSGEFQKANISAYTAYRRAVNKGLIQDKFKQTGFGIKWTKDALEQEAAKYDRASEFQKANVTAYNIYRKAVTNGLIQDKFKKFKTTPTDTTDALEQEAAKYNTPDKFKQANSRTYYAYMYAVKKGLIQNKFKPNNDTSTTTQSINYPNNNPYFGNTTTTFDNLKENKMNDFDLKRFLVENRMTRNSRLLNEQPEPEGIPADDPLAQIPEVPAETPSEPSGEIDVETAKELIFNTKGKFFTVTFIKKDGSERVMNARLGVKKYLKGGTLAYDPAEFNYITVYDMGAKGYRTVNANTIQKLKIGKNEYAIPDAIAESDEPELDENAKPEDIGKGTRLFFKDDKTTYYAKNVAADKKNVFVTRDNDDRIYKKSIAKIIQINNKKF